MKLSAGLRRRVRVDGTSSERAAEQSTARFAFFGFGFGSGRILPTRSKRAIQVQNANLISYLPFDATPRGGDGVAGSRGWDLPRQHPDTCPTGASSTGNCPHHRKAARPFVLTTCNSFNAVPVGRRSPRSHRLTVVTPTLRNPAMTA